MQLVGKAKVSVVADTSQHDKGIDGAKRKVGELGDSTTKMAAVAKVGWAGVAAASLGAVYAIQRVGAESIRTASDLQEVSSKFETVFSTQSGKANKWADELVNSYAMSKRESREYLSSIQDLLVPMGMASDSAGSLSNEVVKLAADLGSFNNKLTSQVIDDYQSALVGNYETMKKYGVVLSAASVEQKALSMNLSKTKEGLTAANKAQAAHQIIVEGSTAAIGDMERTADGYANTTKKLNAQWEDFSSTMGDRFLKSATAVKKELGSILEIMTDIVAPSKEFGTADIDKKIAEYKKSIEEYKKESGKPGSLPVNTRLIAQWEDAIDMLRLHRTALMYKKSEEMAVADSNKKKKLAEETAAAQIKANEEALKEQTALYNLGDDGFEDAIDQAYAEIEKLKKLSEEKEEVLSKFMSASWDSAGYDEEKTFSRLLKEDLEEQKKVAADSKDIFSDITENFTQEVQSEFGTVFSDTLRNDLDSFEDYFSGFNDSLINMWGSTMSQMTMKQMTSGGVSLAGLGAGASFGVMGAVGAGLGVVSSILSKRKEEKAEEERRARIRESLEESLGDELARLKLDDAGYAIHQLNNEIEDLTRSAMDAGYPLEKIIELRNLETKEIIKQSRERYDDLSESMAGWVTGIQRKDWGVSDFEGEFNRLTDEFMSLDNNTKNYQDESIDILKDQFGVLQDIYSIQDAQLSALSGTSKSLETQIWELTHADTMPFSPAEYESQYEKLLGLTSTKDGKLDPAAIADFQAFASRYIKEMSVSGGDTNLLTADVVEDLVGLKGEVDTEMERLTAALIMNENAMAGTEGVTQAINDLIAVTGTEAEKQEIKAATTAIDEYYKSDAFDLMMQNVGSGSFDTIEDAISHLRNISSFQWKPGDNVRDIFGVNPLTDKLGSVIDDYLAEITGAGGVYPPPQTTGTMDFINIPYTNLPQMDYADIGQAIIDNANKDQGFQLGRKASIPNDLNININTPVIIDGREIGRVMVDQKISNPEVAEAFN